MKPSERYHRDADALFEFRNAFVDLINNAKPQPFDLGVEYRAAVPNDLWQSKRRIVALASGPAAAAFQRHSGNFHFRNAVYVMSNVNPVANWEMALRDPEQLRPETLIASVDAAYAKAKQRHNDALQRERGLTGLIAGFLRWPSTLREAVQPDRAGQRKAATALGYTAQGLVLSILASLIAAGLIQLFAYVVSIAD